MWTLPEPLLRCLRTKLFWWSLLVSWGVLLFFLSSIPGSRMPQVDLPNFDKVEHTTFFSGGAFLLAGALATTFPGWTWRRRIATVVGCVSLTGWLDEWHQTFTPGRSGNDFYDWLSDTVGAMIGASAACWFLLFYVRNSKRPGPPRDPDADRIAATADTPT